MCCICEKRESLSRYEIKKYVVYQYHLYNERDYIQGGWDDTCYKCLMLGIRGHFKRKRKGLKVI